MSAAPRRRFALPSWRVPAEVPAAIVVAAILMIAVIGTLGTRGIAAPVGIIAAIPILAAVVLRPRYGVLILIFCMGFVEEFRGGIGDSGAGGNEALRSERTLFYSATLGLPSLYIPDVMVLGSLGLYILRAILQRLTLRVTVDAIGMAMALLGFAIFLSIIVPLAGPDPFGDPILDLRTLGSVTLPENNVSDVARYLPILQYKLFLILFPSYVLGLFFFQEERDIEQVLKVLGLAMLATVALGLFRLGSDPKMVVSLVPVIFDTGGVALMAMAVFYIVGRWTSDHYPTNHTLFYALLVAMLMALILLSFRRTMWGAIGLAAVFFPFTLPRHAWPRLFSVVGLGFAAAMLFAVTTPPGHAMLQSLIQRAGETNLNQSSTLYRFAIMVWMVENGADLPLFGYGFQPLWNERVYIRFFFTSMENVHSLYFWLLLRMGPLGFLACIIATVMIMGKILVVMRRTTDEHYRILVGVVFLSIVMYLFNGVFNPVYANVRHLVPLGLSLALVTQLPKILARRRAIVTPPI